MLYKDQTAFCALSKAGLINRITREPNEASVCEPLWRALPLDLKLQAIDTMSDFFDSQRRGRFVIVRDRRTEKVLAERDQSGTVIDGRKVTPAS
jgi:hypothetical protein